MQGVEVFILVGSFYGLPANAQAGGKSRHFFLIAVTRESARGRLSGVLDDFAFKIVR